MLAQIKQFFNKNNNPGSPTKKSNKTILIVEDNEVDRTLLAKMIISAGYECLTGNNGQEGLQAAIEKNPDLILLDCEMPVMSGQEMFNRLKEQERTRDIPVIFITAVNTPQNIINCFEKQAENYLSKPIHPKFLEENLKSFFNEMNP